MADETDPARFVLDLLVGRGFHKRYTELTHSDAEKVVEQYLHDPGTWTIHLFPSSVTVLGR